MNIKSVIFSILIHLSVVAGLHVYKLTKSEVSEPKKPQPIRIKMNGDKGEVQKKEAGDSKENFVLQDESGIIPCEYSYYGIGWTGANPENGWCQADDIAPRSPLAKIGVKAGWYIKMIDGECPGRGPENTEVEITYKDSENGMPHTIILKREKICMR